jgi:hypothetical protein
MLPSEWVRQRLGQRPYSMQAQALDSIVDNRITCVPACHGSGTSLVAAWAIAWWVDTYAAQEGIAIATAPTHGQVRGILWREIENLQGLAADRGTPLPGELVRGEASEGGRSYYTWRINGETAAFATADHGETIFQGICARYTLVVIDEADYVPDWTWIAAQAVTTNPDCRILALGEPQPRQTGRRPSHFEQYCRNGRANVIHIPASATPNVSGEPADPPVRARLIHPGWVDEKAAEWGVDSPLYKSKILGEFATTDEAPFMIDRHGRRVPVPSQRS